VTGVAVLLIVAAVFLVASIPAATPRTGVVGQVTGVPARTLNAVGNRPVLLGLGPPDQCAPAHQEREAGGPVHRGGGLLPVLRRQSVVESSWR